MYSLKDGSDIIIMGTDKMAIASYYKYREHFNVIGILDNTQKEESWKNGIHIFPPQKLHHLDGAVVIICKQNDLLSAKWFVDNEFRLFDSFIPKTLFDYEYVNFYALYSLSKKEDLDANIMRMTNGKKICMLHGNCQMSVLKKYLIHNEKFMADYAIFEFPEFFRMSNEMLVLYKYTSFFKKLDLFIAHNISEENRWGTDVATSSIRQKLKPECKVVIVTNMYMQAYFPQHKKVNDPIMETWGIKSFAWGDCYLDDFASQEMSVKEILDKVEKEDFLSPEEIRKKFQNDFAEMRRREESVDVKILDYLEEYAEREVLFYSVNHPKNKVFNVLARRLLVFLNYYASVEDVVFKYEEHLDNEKSLKIACEAIYPCVSEYIYGEKRNIDFNLPGEISITQYVQFAEYVKYYLNYIWNCIK